MDLAKRSANSGKVPDGQLQTPTIALTDLPERAELPAQMHQLDREKYAEATMNMTLVEPPKWGWTAVGGVADLLTPHEVSRPPHL